MSSTQDINSRNEYRDDGLKTAVAWLWSAEKGVSLDPLKFPPSDEYMARELPIMRAVLRGGELRANESSAKDAFRWYILRRLGIAQVYGASSARVESGAEQAS